MSRDVSASNLAEIDSSHVHEVMMVLLDFDAPVYAHSGVGTITYNSNDYIGVGTYGGISAIKESEKPKPTNLTLSLSGVDSSLISESLDSGKYGDSVTIYSGFRSDDGTLIDDPIVLFSGTYEYSTSTQGGENAISIVVKHDLAILDEINGSRFTDEDQQFRFSGDTGFEYVADMANLKLLWGGGRVSSGGGGGGRPRGGNRLR